MTQAPIERLIAAATDAAQEAYCPYSRFAVGAALLAADGRVWTGANVENASYGLTICAERAAVAAAVSAGARRFRALAVVAAGNRMPCPCGACRQVLAEFGGPELLVITACVRRPARETFRLGDLLPRAFCLRAGRRRKA